MTTLASIKNEIDKLKAAWKQAQDGVQPQEIPAAMRNFRFKSPDPGLHHGQIKGEPQLQSGRQHHQQAVLTYIPDPDLHHGQARSQLHGVRHGSAAVTEPVHDVRHGSPPLPAGQYHSHAQIMKEKARGLPDTSRAQQSITGKPSTHVYNIGL